MFVIIFSHFLNNYNIYFNLNCDFFVNNLIIEQKEDLKSKISYRLKVRNTKKTVKCSVKNKRIASVSKKGTVKAKNPGTTYVYAKVSGTNKKLKCKIRVFKKKSSSKSSSYVDITSTGKKYHRHKTCSNMRSPQKVKLNKAKSLGYSACKKCYT